MAWSKPISPRKTITEIVKSNNSILNSNSAVQSLPLKDASFLLEDYDTIQSLLKRSLAQGIA